MKEGSKIGGWAFLIGVVIAIIIAVLGVLTSSLIWVLVIIGIVVGFLNVAREEASSFLMSAAVLIIASAFGQGVVAIIPVLERMLEAILILFIPATIVVAVRNVFTIARK